MWGSLKDKVYETCCHTLRELRNNIRSENSTVPSETLQRVNSKVSCRYAEYIRRKDAKPSETPHKKQIRRSVELVLIDQVGNNTLGVTTVVVVLIVVVVAVVVHCFTPSHDHILSKFIILGERFIALMFKILTVP
jgi:hypothetical protein